MISILNKIFKDRKNLSYKDQSFKQLKKNTDIEKIFNSVSQFSETSEIRYVGGCVRKIINQETFDDIDLATNLKPSLIAKILKENEINFFETGVAHGTLTARINKKNFEITSLRKDLVTDGRHAKVEFSDDWLEDSFRRDFTINAIYSDINGNLFDPHNGKKDLENGIIKFIGDPEKRIKEDYLRILRYVRFFLNYSNHDHDPEIVKLIKQNLMGVKMLSKERLLDELKKLIFSKGFLKLNDDIFCLEIIELIFPELKNIKIFKNINKFAIKFIENNDFIFLISLMIIDETDNARYFLYKYNISNNDKKRIFFLYETFSKPLKKNFFSEKNLWKILYLKNKDSLIDILNFQIFKSKTIDKKLLKMKDFFVNQQKPIFPIKAKDLIEKYHLKEGIELGKKLKEIENIWINNSFKISEKEIEKLVNH